MDGSCTVTGGTEIRGHSERPPSEDPQAERRDGGAFLDTAPGPARSTVQRSAPVATACPSGQAPSPRGQITPLSPRRYKVEITVSEETHEKLLKLQDLLAHQIPSGDPAIIVDHALDRLLEHTLKRKAALTTKPRRGNRRSDKRTRAIGADVRREVWKRDGGRCAYISNEGTRCAETRLLEFAHLKAWAAGGDNTVDNIRLLCRGHNDHEADCDYGRLFMEKKKRIAPQVRESVASFHRPASPELTTGRAACAALSAQAHSCRESGQAPGLRAAELSRALCLPYLTATVP